MDLWRRVIRKENKKGGTKRDNGKRNEGVSVRWRGREKAFVREGQ